MKKSKGFYLTLWGFIFVIGFLAVSYATTISNSASSFTDSINISGNLFLNTISNDVLVVNSHGFGNYPSVSAAISAVSPGQTIFVAPGIYNESHLELPANVDLKCSGVDSTTIQNNTASVFITVYSNSSIRDCSIFATGNESIAINASAKLDRFRLQDSNIKATLMGLYIPNLVYSSNTIVSDNRIQIDTISSQAACGISFGGSGEKSMFITGNDIIMNRTAGTQITIGIRKEGHTAEGRGDIIANNIFLQTNTSFSTNPNAGIGIFGTGETTIISNHIYAIGTGGANVRGIHDSGTFLSNHGSSVIGNLFEVTSSGGANATGAYIHPQSASDEKKYYGNIFKTSSTGGGTAWDIDVRIDNPNTPLVIGSSNSYSLSKYNQQTANSPYRDRIGFFSLPHVTNATYQSLSKREGDMYWINDTDNIFIYNGTATGIVGITWI